jgi:hypothetical protein
MEGGETTGWAEQRRAGKWKTRLTGPETPERDPRPRPLAASSEARREEDPEAAAANQPLCTKRGSFPEFPLDLPSMDPGLVREEIYVEGMSEQAAKQTARTTTQWRSRRRGRRSGGGAMAQSGTKWRGGRMFCFRWNNTGGFLQNDPFDIFFPDGGSNLLRTFKTKFPRSYILPPFQNIRCFRFVKQMYLDMF